MNVFDETSFKELFFEHYDQLFSGFFNRVKDYDTAQELTQATFIKFWKYRESIDFTIELRTQLFRKGKLVLIDWFRMEARQRQLLEELSKIEVPKEEISSDMMDLLKNQVNHLPPMRKEVFSLAYFEGLTHKEIAEKLQISIRTVENHKHRALNQLRKILTIIAIIHFIQ